MIDPATQQPLVTSGQVPEQPITSNPQHQPEAPASADHPLAARPPGSDVADAAVLAQSRRHTRRSFVVTAASAAAGYGLYRGLLHAPSSNMQPLPLQSAYEFNAALSRTLFHDLPLAPTYPLHRAETLRVNGIVGLKRALKPESWRLQLVGANAAAGHPRFVEDVTAWNYEYAAEASTEDQGHDTKVDPNLLRSSKSPPAQPQTHSAEDDNHTGRKPRGLAEAGESDSTLRSGTPGLLLTMSDLEQLPRHELVTQFKCIEGWSQIVHWAGFRMADLLAAYPPAPINGANPRFLYMETPDGDYYTGYDLHAMRHPQALLVTEMMGAPLTQPHGAPLRLHMPTKYGYKQIKRIALIAYTNDKPDDYWTKLGYDWYAGL